MTTVPETTPSPFTFSTTHPIHRQYHFPPFYTPQPILSTHHAQLSQWAVLILDYCRHNRIYSLSLSQVSYSKGTRPDLSAHPHAVLFYNAAIPRWVEPAFAREIVDWMAGEEGGMKAEWRDKVGGSGKKGEDAATGDVFWVYWRRPEEWAGVIEGWVEGSGQKGVVLTVYELLNGDATAKEEWRGMDEELMVKSLQILVKRGRAQVFGGDGQLGVKFF
ncbi:ESCRT-II complex, vps25 subunit [Pseudovirgaria hyperparasitica]|uniref:ESCRT-II complex subunit VPS25 n=1 Tax=Pseudovirgaria hyperparasitica TaxID=470096 RepID=A0A6A6WJ86_9PEZI|nr:ESCRT-II complex, vps25 subunit [Pseudovirgaria hyperparasitica]KAF2761817.1 ESCRT-II complex, vps25 subunit [Pseudovirgaria hyperparasitica]